ncbi:MAG: MucR family transcriptional regulator [Alphaproteobacteria bacterium]|nr:MucR family transcriptional regulator [Alphaproteobacteria bacterium]
MNAPESESLESNTPLLSMVTEIVGSYLSYNQLPPSELAGLILGVHAAMKSLANGATPVPMQAQKPAVPIKKSVMPDHIVCLEDGKKLTMLKRHLRSVYGLSPDQYRAKWGLPADYPMVAPNYAKKRSEFAKQIGLGTSPKRPSGGGRKRGG